MPTALDGGSAWPCSEIVWGSLVMGLVLIQIQYAHTKDKQQNCTAAQA